MDSSVPPPDSPDAKFRPLFLSLPQEPTPTDMELEHATHLPPESAYLPPEYLKPYAPPPLKSFRDIKDPATWPKPEGVTWGDHVLDPDPNKPLNARQREVARLLFLGTKTLTEIAEHVGYTMPWVHTLSTNRKVKAEIERLHDLLFEHTVGDRIKGMGPRAASVIESIIADPKEKTALKADVSRWVLEKLTGKARQEVDVQSSTLSQFMQMLAEQKAGTPKLTEQNVPQASEPVIKEVEEDKSKFASWVDSNT